VLPAVYPWFILFVSHLIRWASRFLGAAGRLHIVHTEGQDG